MEKDIREESVDVKPSLSRQKVGKINELLSFELFFFLLSGRDFVKNININIINSPDRTAGYSKISKWLKS